MQLSQTAPVDVWMNSMQLRVGKRALFPLAVSLMALALCPLVARFAETHGVLLSDRRETYTLSVIKHGAGYCISLRDPERLDASSVEGSYTVEVRQTNTRRSVVPYAGIYWPQYTTTLYSFKRSRNPTVLPFMQWPDASLLIKEYIAGNISCCDGERLPRSIVELWGCPLSTREWMDSGPLMVVLVYGLYSLGIACCIASLMITRRQRQGPPLRAARNQLAEFPAPDAPHAN